MRSGLGARATLWLVLLFLYAPVAVLVLYSFNDARFSVGWEGFTLDWYRRLLESDSPGPSSVGSEHTRAHMAP